MENGRGKTRNTMFGNGKVKFSFTNFNSNVKAQDHSLVEEKLPAFMKNENIASASSAWQEQYLFLSLK